MKLDLSRHRHFTTAPTSCLGHPASGEVTTPSWDSYPGAPAPGPGREEAGGAWLRRSRAARTRGLTARGPTWEGAVRAFWVWSLLSPVRLLEPAAWHPDIEGEGLHLLGIAGLVAAVGSCLYLPPLPHSLLIQVIW